MVTLALDTTTRAGSCALWRDGALVEERAGDPARTHAERLPGDLAALLAAHGLRVADVDLYAVASGPGSFTGLRVGIATVQALALVHGRKVVPVSALEALAQHGARAASAPREAAIVLVGAWMEAYRGEVFGALYRVGPRVTPAGWAAADLVALEEIAAPTVGDPRRLAGEWTRVAEDLTAQLTAHPTRGATVIVIGDAVPSTRELLEAAWLHCSVGGARLLDAPPLAGIIARLAHAQPERAVLPHAIIPLYVRRPDAELARDRRDAAGGGSNASGAGPGATDAGHGGGAAAVSHSSSSPASTS